MEYKPYDPKYWAQLSPDIMFKVLMSEIKTFLTSMSNSNDVMTRFDELSNRESDSKQEFIDDMLQFDRERIQRFRDMLHAANGWLDSYQKTNPPA